MTLRAVTSRVPRALVLSIALVTTATGRGAQTRPSASPAAPDPCNIETPERVVAVADVHGAYDRFVKILSKAEILDASQHWSGGRAVLVQLGDVLDRGPDSRKVLDLLRRLEGEAAKAGGQVHALLGNHEVMWMMGDFRYVSRGEYAAFQSPDSTAQRDRYAAAVADIERASVTASGRKFDEKGFVKRLRDETPLGLAEIVAGFGPAGSYGEWLRGHDVMVRINGIAYLHGGTTRAVAALGCAAINTQARSELRTFGSLTSAQLNESLIAGPNGPLWYRGLVSEESPLKETDVDAILKSLDARAIVVGHTVAPDPRVRWRFGRRVIQLDSGMLDGELFPGGSASALEIAGEALTVIYERRRESLPPPRAASSTRPLH